MPKKIEKEGEVATVAAPVKTIRKVLSDASVLRVIDAGTRSGASLAILGAIDELGPEATVARVLALASSRFSPPRSVPGKAEATRPAFLRGYVTFLLREGKIAVA